MVVVLSWDSGVLGLGYPHVLMHCKTLLSGLGWSLGKKTKTNHKSSKISEELWLTPVSPGSTFLFRLFHLCIWPSFSSFVFPRPFHSAVFLCVLKYCKSSQISNVFLRMSLWKQIFKKYYVSWEKPTSRYLHLFNWEEFISLTGRHFVRVIWRKNPFLPQSTHIDWDSSQISSRECM